MTHPPRTFSPPILLYPSDLLSQPLLTTQITTLTNSAFARSKAHDTQKWSIRPRFPSIEAYHDQMLVEGAVVAVILDRVEGDGEVQGKVVACAAAVPWKGGWMKECAGREEGWEIKALAVDGGAEYLKKGLAVQVMGALEEYLVKEAKKREEKGVLSLWILAAECINGHYWRRRGYKEVRRSTEGDMTWGCQTVFDLVVFKREVEF